VYFFEGDSLAHHEGITAQRRYVGTLDGYVAEMFESGGGVDRVLDDYAVLVVMTTTVQTQSLCAFRHWLA
jgi:hypothetical protein